MPAETKKRTKARGSEKAALFQCPPGIPDVLPEEEEVRRAVCEAGETVAALHDFRHIEPPLVELASAIEAGLGAGGLDGGDSSLYFVKGKREQLALRPDAAIGVMRAHLEHRLGHLVSPLKVWTSGPQFRWRSPRSGGPNLSHEVSYHLIGDSDAIYDVEAILAAIEFLHELRFRDLKLYINTLGCRVCRPNYQEKLKSYYRGRREKLCRECAGALDRNPSRCLTCADPDCRALRADAPIILDYLCQNCNNHFKAVLELVEDSGIIYEPNPYLIPDISYYNRTVFEVVSAGAPPEPVAEKPARARGAAKSPVPSAPAEPEPLAAGGRYDYLAELLHGRMVPAVMASIHVDAVVAALRAAAFTPRQNGKRQKVFFVAVGEQAKKASVRLMAELRAGGVIVAEALGKKSLKSQLRIAERTQVSQVLLVGQKEAFEGTVLVRDMHTGAQETLLADRFVEEVKKRLK